MYRRNYTRYCTICKDMFHSGFTLRQAWKYCDIFEQDYDTTGPQASRKITTQLHRSSSKGSLISGQCLLLRNSLAPTKILNVP